MNDTNDLYHHGILGQKWGRLNGPPYPLSRSQMSAAERKDAKWARKKYKKLYKEALPKSSQRELNKFAKKEIRKDSSVLSTGKVSKTYINSYNKKMAELMNENSSDIRAPSGREVKWVAKRGEIGVHLALADQGYNMQQVKNGIYGSGRIAYKQENVNIG